MNLSSIQKQKIFSPQQISNSLEKKVWTPLYLTLHSVKKGKSYTKVFEKVEYFQLAAEILICKLEKKKPIK